MNPLKSNRKIRLRRRFNESDESQFPANGLSMAYSSDEERKALLEEARKHCNEELQKSGLSTFQDNLDEAKRSAERISEIAQRIKSLQMA